MRIGREKKDSQIITAFRIINNTLTIPISKTDIKGRLEKEVEIKSASLIRFIPKKNHTKKSKTIPKMRK